MVARGIAKTVTWLTRLLQFLFAIILMGIASYMIHKFRDAHWNVPDEVILPEVASVLGVVVTAFSIVAIWFLGYTLQFVAAFLDFVLFVLYLTSAALLRDNYHRHGDDNPLKWALVDARRRDGERGHENTQSGLVRMLVAGCVIQTLLFFFTTLLGAFVAMNHEDRHTRRSRHAV
jgi:hypothetical protein